MVGTLTQFSGVLTVVTTLTAVVFGALFGKNKATVSSYKESNAAYAELVKVRDAQHEEDVRIIRLRDEKVDVLQAALDVLNERVTQAKSIDKLIFQQGQQHKEVITAITGMTLELGNVAKSFTKVVQ